MVRFGRGIGCRRGSDGIASHLGIQSGRGLIVDDMMQFKGSERFSVIEADGTDGLLISIELRDRVVDKAILVEDHRYGSLKVHINRVPYKLRKSSFVWKMRLI